MGTASAPESEKNCSTLASCGASVGLYTRYCIANIVQCMSYEKGGRRGGHILPNSRAIILQQCGQCRRAGRMEGRLIHAQTTKSKPIILYRSSKVGVGQRSGEREGLTRYIYTVHRALTFPSTLCRQPDLRGGTARRAGRWIVYILTRSTSNSSALGLTRFISYVYFFITV